MMDSQPTFPDPEPDEDLITAGDVASARHCDIKISNLPGQLPSGRYAMTFTGMEYQPGARPVIRFRYQGRLADAAFTPDEVETDWPGKPDGSPQDETRDAAEEIRQADGPDIATVRTAAGNYYRTRSGKIITDEMIEIWAAEAERFDELQERVRRHETMPTEAQAEIMQRIEHAHSHAHPADLERNADLKVHTHRHSHPAGNTGGHDHAHGLLPDMPAGAVRPRGRAAAAARDPAGQRRQAGARDRGDGPRSHDHRALGRPGAGQREVVERPDRAMAVAVTTYHCYIEYHEAVYAVDVDAGDPVAAAVKAAQKENIAGTWVVISGTPVDVVVTEHSHFEGQIAEQPLPYRGEYTTIRKENPGMRSRAALLLALIMAALAVTASTASAKPGPPGELAEGHITADQSRHPCLTAAGTIPGARVFVAPCTSKLNADQRWKILRIHNVIIVALAAQPGSCLGAVPEKIKQQRRVLYLARTYDCGQQITVPEGLLLGHIGSVYNTIIQASGGKLLSSAYKLGGLSRFSQWLPSNGNIPFTQVWLFPKFKVFH